MRGRFAESLPYSHFRSRATGQTVPADTPRRLYEATATIINGMQPRIIGRALGIGVRVAGRVAGQRIAASRPPAAVAAQPPPSIPVAGRDAAAQAGQLAAHAGHIASQGLGGFLRPFRRVGAILWLEVTGVLFLLPVIVFAPALWRESVGYSHTTVHRTFWIAALIVAVFLYLSISSFWRARRR